MKRLLVSFLLLAAPAPASAACSAANQFGFSFANQAAATLAYGSTYTYTATTTGGATRPVTVAIAQNGLTSTVVNGEQMPAISASFTGADATKKDLVLGGAFITRTIDILGGINVITVTFTFAQPIRDFALTLHDVDYGANQYRDWFQVTGSNGSTTYTPSMSSPAGNSNASGGARTATGSSVTFGPGTLGVVFTADMALGNGTSGNNSETGTVNASFVQPVTSVTVRYGNAVDTGATVTGQQAVGLAGISFCPMPAIAVVKKSAPVAGTYGAYNLPGNDVTYTLTVTNTGGSPVDTGAIVLTDVLPASVTFKNVAGASGTPFTLTPNGSGVTLASSGLSYSSDGGSTWTYTPASGYDAAVNAVRITPSGTMAANSSFSVSFVTRVK